MDEKSGRFLVTAADDAAVELADVDDGQVVALSSNPGLERGEVVEGTVAPDPPLGVSWSLIEVEARFPIAVEAIDEPPGRLARRLADDVEAGELTRAGVDGGELHVIGVPDAETVAAREDVVDDEGTLRRAARLGTSRVEVRAADGVIAVRYLEE